MKTRTVEVPDVEFGTIVVLHRGDIDTRLARWLRLVPQVFQELVTPEGNQIPAQRNLGVRKMRGEYVLMVDSDTVPQADALERLLARNLPIVGGVVFERFPPFNVAATKALEPPMKYMWSELPQRGVVPVVSIGTACLLIRRRVLETVEPPWFRCGQILLDHLMEDSEFCLRAAEAGFPVYLDCEVRAVHKIAGYVGPGDDGRTWLDFSGPIEYRVPVDEIRSATVDRPREVFAAESIVSATAESALVGGGT